MACQMEMKDTGSLPEPLYSDGKEGQARLENWFGTQAILGRFWKRLDEEVGGITELDPEGWEIFGGYGVGWWR